MLAFMRRNFDLGVANLLGNRELQRLGEKKQSRVFHLVVCYQFYVSQHETHPI